MVWFVIRKVGNERTLCWQSWIGEGRRLNATMLSWLHVTVAVAYTTGGLALSCVRVVRVVGLTLGLARRMVQHPASVF